MSRDGEDPHVTQKTSSAPTFPAAFQLLLQCLHLLLQTLALPLCASFGSALQSLHARVLEFLFRSKRFLETNIWRHQEETDVTAQEEQQLLKEPLTPTMHLQARLKASASQQRLKGT